MISDRTNLEQNQLDENRQLQAAIRKGYVNDDYDPTGLGGTGPAPEGYMTEPMPSVALSC